MLAYIRTSSSMALHTLASLSKLDPQIAENAFERLGDMLRYALRDDNRELVEFSEELAFTEQYIAFEQLRYEDRLKVTFKIDADSSRFDVPPFSLQILAENAVHHAVSIRPEGGVVVIKAESSPSKLRLTVTDDGPATELGDNSLLQGLDGKSAQFGLRSLRERLENSFGQAARMETERSPIGFVAYFEVPAPSEDVHDAVL